jgi:hypothetical protein
VTAVQSVQWLCERPLARAFDACARLDGLLRSSAAQAAEKKAWLLPGEAGQGKTHSLVDATRRAGRPPRTRRLSAPLTRFSLTGL